MRIALDWGPSTVHGWGLYALNLALAWANDPDIELWMPYGEPAIDPLRAAMLKPPAWSPNEADVFLHALGNEFLPEPDTSRDRTIGVIFFEEPLSAAAIERAKRYPLIIVGSSWNGRLLEEAGVPWRLIFQGVDRTLFHWAAKLYSGAFQVFSGCKAEHRKGQDLVLKAFSIFAARHRDAVLVTAWQSPFPQLAAAMGAPIRDGRVDVKLWAKDFGIDAGQIVDLGIVHNPLLPQVLREMSCAVFASRAEGGTNLAAMEALACGVPTFVSFNTGHVDLADAARFLRQSSTDAIGRGETAIEAIVERLERHYTTPCQPRILSGFKWSEAADQLKEACRQCATMPA